MVINKNNDGFMYWSLFIKDVILNLKNNVNSSVSGVNILKAFCENNNSYFGYSSSCFYEFLSFLDEFYGSANLKDSLEFMKLIESILYTDKVSLYKLLAYVHNQPSLNIYEEKEVTDSDIDNLSEQALKNISQVIELAKKYNLEKYENSINAFLKGLVEHLTKLAKSLRKSYSYSIYLGEIDEYQEVYLEESVLWSAEVGIKFDMLKSKLPWNPTYYTTRWLGIKFYEDFEED